MANWTYFLHYARRLQDNNNSVETLVDGDRGMGKSTLTVAMAREYIKLFGIKCPHCGNEFYKTVWDYKQDGKGGYKFFIPEGILNGKIYLRCKEEKELDLKSHTLNKVSGCGKLFLYSERKKIKWSAEKYIAYDNEEAQEKMLTLPIGSPLIFDEAINFMDSLSFNRSDSKALKRLFTVIRPRRLFMFFNIPEMMRIDSYYRETMSHFWFRCLDKGTAAIFEKNKWITRDKYEIKRLQKMGGVIKYSTSLDKIKRTIKSHPCFFDTITWGELPENIYEEYELVRNSRNLQRQIKAKEFSNKDMAKVAVYNLFNNWDAIAVDVNRSKQRKMTYNIMLNSILLDPLTKKRMIGEDTVRAWVRGVGEYIKTKGSEADVFDGQMLENTQKENKEVYEAKVASPKVIIT